MYNPKRQFIETVFGPPMSFMEKYNIYGGWLALILFGLYIYFSIFRNRGKNKKFTFFEKYTIALWCIGFIFTIIMQLAMLNIIGYGAK